MIKHLILLALLGVIDAIIGVSTEDKLCAFPIAMIAGAAVGAGTQLGGMALQGAQGKKSQERQYEYNTKLQNHAAIS